MLARERHQIDLVFAIVTAVRIGAAFSPPCPLRYRPHARNLKKHVSQLRADAYGLLERGTRHASGMHHIMPFPKFRQKISTQARQDRETRSQYRCGETDGKLRPVTDCR